jgi:oligopeptide/dipeptide ABC transporter ATP-binding protein
MTARPIIPSDRGETILDLSGLSLAFGRRSAAVTILHNISFWLARGEAVGMVGESGSGKSVTAAALLGLLGRTARILEGTAIFEGRDLLRLGQRELQAVRGGRIGIVFQDPLNSLNPVVRVGAQIIEMLHAHRSHDSSRYEERVNELLRLVGIGDPARVCDAYPHQLSGGMRQRAMIAMAIACEPALLIADEPTTALDVTIQAQILEHFKELRTRLGMALLLITHDLGIVAGTTSRVIVMYAGHIVETGPTAEVLATPLHPYTEGLKRSVPRLDRPRAERLEPIEGSPPDPSRPLPGCPFKPRCPKRIDRCDTAPRLSPAGPAREVACWVVSESAAGAP